MKALGKRRESEELAEIEAYELTTVLGELP